MAGVPYRGVAAGAAAVARDVLVGGVLVVAAALRQVAGVVDFVVAGGRPDLVLILVVGIALVRGPVGGAVTGFAGGLLLDSLGLGLLGITSLALVGVGYLVGIWGERMADRAAVRPLVAVAGASVLADLTALAIAVLVGEGSSIEARMLSAAVVGAMLNVLLAIALVPLVRRLFRRPRPRPLEPATVAPPVEGIVA